LFFVFSKSKKSRIRGFGSRINFQKSSQANATASKTKATGRRTFEKLKTAVAKVDISAQSAAVKRCVDFEWLLILPLFLVACLPPGEEIGEGGLGAVEAIPREESGEEELQQWQPRV
jgi:hypothetical protein